ncbi:VIT domain-containing protein [Polynucleobacter sp. JS-Fieb-80-E5]|uniref:VIT domain-containing protein n=1 Tax=Polynucleobacter sp. JS-Fieb-80-E5 TaxID=2081050 RepID=UPI001C0E092F|nr:VIT domain-containing protein [Polynucleobacter sp. JS-Fieb-80-E5]MBU3617627.1 VWA domain-containing protein [Polynucleobacter sp. JS-Fieb-80-E5]
MIELDEVVGLSTDDGEQMALQSVSAKGKVQGLLLEMTIRQQYKNTTKKTLETVYTFPMGWGATFMDLSVEMGGKRLSGVVTEKKDAEEQYENAISKGDAPIMLEKNSDGLYTVNLGSLKPKEEAVIEYTYSQLLRFEEGHVRLTLPTTIAPRYGDSSQGGIKKHHGVETDFLVEYPFSLSLLLSGGMEKATVECPSHQVQVTTSEKGLEVGLARSGFLDRDFILNLSKLENESFFIVTPDKQMGPEGCTVLASFCPPALANQKELSADIKILVDCSGSMAGDSIESAKRALHHVLSNLREDDRFSYSLFGSKVKHEFSSLKPVNQFNIGTASLLVSNTEANMGGTEIEDALLSTFKLKGTEKKADVLLITDGEVWDTSNIIAAAKNSGHRIFAVGVGTSPAETLLRELAEMTGGACELVSPKEDIEKAIVRMFNRIHLPRAKEIEINWGTNETPEWTVGTNTAIFSGNTHHVFAGFKSIPNKPAHLSYQLGASSERIGVGANSITQANDGNLARLGASQRLSALTEEKQLCLALEYQLITEQTNCILVHVRSVEEKATDMPELQKIAQMQAAGWGGAGTVQETVLHCMAPMQDSIQYSMASVSACRVPSNNIDYSQYDLPRVFRSSREADTSSSLDSFDRPKSLLDRAADYFEIPAFLRKQANADHMPPAKIDPLLPHDIVSIANHDLQNRNQICSFVKLVESHLLSDELKYALDKLQESMSSEQAWTIVMSWVLFKLSDAITWNEKTKETIELLVNELDPKLFNTGLDVVNRVFDLLKPKF